jgi:hypothetical protein
MGEPKATVQGTESRRSVLKKLGGVALVAGASPLLPVLDANASSQPRQGTMPAFSSDADTDLAAAFASYQTAIGTAYQNVIGSGVAIDDAELADGTRFVLGMAAFTNWVIQLDPDYPVFTHFVDGLTRDGLANPDDYYLLARVQDGADYLITGTRGTTADFVIQAFTSAPNQQNEVPGALDPTTLRLGPDGRFEVIASSTQPGTGNWLPIEPGTQWILIRYCFDDWARERAGRVYIQEIGKRGVASNPLTPTTLTSRLDQASTLLLNQSLTWPATSKVVLSMLPPNFLPPPQLAGGSVPGQWTVIGLFQLDADQALVLTSKKSNARYQGLQIGSVWFDYFDYANRQTSLSRAQSSLSSDGLYRHVVSSQDPGVPNWIDSVGHQRGLILFRWQGYPGSFSSSDFPTATVVPVSQVLREFPRDVKLLTPAEREAQLAERQTQLALRTEP